MNIQTIIFFQQDSGETLSDFLEKVNSVFLESLFGKFFFFPPESVRINEFTNNKYGKLHSIVIPFDHTKSPNRQKYVFLEDPSRLREKDIIVRDG